MNYEYVESLVVLAKGGNEDAKEKLAEEFKSLILKLSYRTFVHGYDPCDLQNEGYRILFKCLSLYNPESHRFVAYATNGIKNRINELIRKYMTHLSTDSGETLVLTGCLEESIEDDNFSVDNNIMHECRCEILQKAIKVLPDKDKQLIDFVFFKNNTLKSYAASQNICYSTAFRRRNSALNKLHKYLNSTDSDFSALN